jgi:hypothetical protein
MASSSYAQFNPARLRSYVLRLPLATRLLLLAIVALWIAAIPLPWLREFARLEPAKMDLTQSMHKTHTTRDAAEPEPDKSQCTASTSSR